MSTEKKTINSPLDALILGRERIAAGWVQNVGKKDGCYCALHSLFGDEREVGSISWEAAELLEDYLISSEQSEETLVDWNDAEGRTQDQVLALFDAVIEQVKGWGQERVT